MQRYALNVNIVQQDAHTRPANEDNLGEVYTIRLCKGSSVETRLTLRLLMSYIYIYIWSTNSWRFWITHDDAPQSVGLFWTSDQLVAETSTWQHTTLTTDKYPCPRWDSNPRSQQVSGLWPLTCWDRGFESHRGHGYLSVVNVVCCQVEVSATSWWLVQRSPTDCGASLRVI